jgi:hypothetical protein
MIYSFSVKHAERNSCAFQIHLSATFSLRHEIRLKFRLYPCSECSVSRSVGHRTSESDKWPTDGRPRTGHVVVNMRVISSDISSLETVAEPTDGRRTACIRIPKPKSAEAGSQPLSILQANWRSYMIPLVDFTRFIWFSIARTIYGSHKLTEDARRLFWGENFLPYLSTDL